MSSNEIAIKVANLAKRYEIYETPGDRLKQFLFPRIRRFFGLSQNQYFREFWALKNISFQIEKGKTVGIIGRNGSGKSTLLQIICGTLTPTNGLISTSGRIAALLELGSGFNAEFTGRENVFLNAAVLGLTQEEIHARYSDIVNFADIGDFIDQPVKTYSSGMLVRLAFAVIAHVDADILIIDEALAVGDAFFTQKCMRFLRKFMESGAVLFVSHDTASVQALCDEVFWLDKGSMIASGDPKKICAEYLKAFYESQYGPSEEPPRKNNKKVLFNSQPGDQRLSYLNNSNLRNDLQVFRFEDQGGSFGSGKARIESVVFLDEANQSLSWMVGGERVRLQIQARIYEAMIGPIVGFYVKDRLGQSLFGDNTFLAGNALTECNRGDLIESYFEFMMPILPPGDYSVTVAIANGNPAEHEQHHWIHDAIFFKSTSSSAVTGLVGIPMLDIRITILDPYEQ